MKRVLVAAGGTGGHFYPGLVAALELRKRGWEPLLVVKRDDPAKARLEAEGLPCLEVDLGGMPRRPGPELVSFAWRLWTAMGLLSRTVRDFEPQLVLGMGGYLTFPCVWAARRRGVPAALHESNALLGLANKASAALGATLFWGLPPAGGEAGAVVGTPVRPELREPKDKSESRRALGLDPARPVVLVFGGSQGAKGVNDALPAAAKAAGSPQVLHLAGKGKADDARKAYAAAGVKADVRDYLEDMASAYGAADIVVCRSGASTLAELAAQKKASILVPYPHAAADHQNVNAMAFEKAGTAERILEGDLAARLGTTLAGLLESTERRTKMEKSFENLALPEARRIPGNFADELERLTK